MDSFPRSEGFYDCSADMGSLALCKEQTSFLSYNFFASLYFNDDQELDTVSLTTDFTPDTYASIIGAISRDFSLAFMAGQASELDIVSQMKEGSIQTPQDMEQKVSQFEGTNLANGYLDLIYFENSYARQWEDYSNFQNMLMETPEGVRMSELVIYYDEVYGPSMEVSFALPGKTFERLKDQAQNAPIEDF
ncbi:hypothetical protein CVH10_01510 [Halomonas sp. ND22Bw]|uniref:hypothetical protein n=1 Tax=Halomonas sp. ND22Bw TaxID=2054178 RepID=UPI000D0BB776|nr:hypothetical protein CVH10_01510 [Halomonas sp. ND22Bw]